MSTEAVVRSALERLNNLNSCDTELIKEVEKLNSDLGGVADAISHADAEINREAMELAYDTEDSMECFVRRQGQEAEKLNTTHLRCLYNKYYGSSSERSFAEDVHVLCRRATELTARISSSSSSAHQPTIDQHSSSSVPDIDTTRSEFVPVGLDEYTKNLKDLLIGPGQPNFMSIAICGMPGIGKTTLAISVFNDAEVKKSFSCRGWATVSIDFQSRDIVGALLSSLSPDSATKKKLAAVETMELITMLHQFLYNKKYLICLDDVWSTEVWDSLRFLFPDQNVGSRILITTRDQHVARYTSRSSAQIQMRMLDEEQSLQLLLMNSANADPGTSNSEIAEIKKQILRLCGGVPLAIIIIGQIMSTTSSQKWELILRNLHPDPQGHAVMDILELSYKQLPFQVKPCFVYMGHFPPDQPISVDKLHLLWTAEGFLSKTKETAEEYLKELVDRYLVIAVENGYQEYMAASKKFISVQVHDLVRDLCISRGKQEDFFEVLDFSHANKQRTSTCRLAVYLDKFKDTDDVTLIIPDAKRIRSILFFDTVETTSVSTWPSEVADLTTFQRIRVLDFDGVNFLVKRLPRGMEKLIYLRYLSFQGCYMEEFPSTFGSFSFLETLDLRVVDSCIMTIPNVLRKLTRLRHLYFPLAFQCHGSEKLKLDSLKSLQVVENFNAGTCDAGDLLHLEHLQILKGSVDGNNLDLELIINSIKKMKAIGHSSLVVKRFDSYSEGRRLLVAELLQCETVHALDLEGHLGFFPRDIVFGVNFTEMVFNGSEFSENPMSILGKLPNLRSLVLSNDAILGSKLVCYESDFPQLRSLKLASLQYLETWEVEDNAMASLAILTIEQCDKLEMLPSELTCKDTLQILRIHA